MIRLFDFFRRPRQSVVVNVTYNITTTSPLTEDAAHDFANEVARATRDELRKLAVRIK
jgi:hypothetical protein